MSECIWGFEGVGECEKGVVVSLPVLPWSDAGNLLTMARSVWHQQMRRLCSAPGIFLARDVLHLRKGSFASKYLQLLVGFGISGVVHAGASMLIHRSLEDDGAFAVFIGQAVIIMIEDHIIGLGKRLGFKDSVFWRLLGFVWTVLAIGASTEKWTSKVVGHGMWVHDRKPDYFGIGPK